MFFLTCGLVIGFDSANDQDQPFARVGIRPRELRERRFAIAPLVFVNDEGNRESYGLDLDEPAYDQCWLEQPSAAYPEGTKKLKVIRLHDQQCWGLLLWHEKWRIVPPHGSVSVLTVPGIVQVK